MSKCEDLYLSNLNGTFKKLKLGRTAPTMWTDPLRKILKPQIEEDNNPCWLVQVSFLYTIICIGINRGVSFFFFFSTEFTVGRTKNKIPLLIPIQIVVQRRNLNQWNELLTNSVWCVKIFHRVRQHRDLKLTLIFWTYPPLPQVWQTNYIVLLSNCLETNFHNFLTLIMQAMCNT